MAIWEEGRRAKDEGLHPVELGRFGGLNLRDDPQEVGWQGAIDLLNVDLDRAGRVRQRDGYTKYTTSAATNDLGFLLGVNEYDSVLGSNVDLLMAVHGTAATNKRVRAYSDGSSFTESSNLVGLPANLVTYATSGGTVIYGGYGTSSTTIMKCTALGVFSYPAAGYSGPLVAVQPIDNRLVLVNSNDRVRFSGAGTPETFAANDFVDLDPGQGYGISAAISWGDQLFVFKHDRFFVFYGNNTDAAGDTAFNYKTVNIGVGCPSGAVARGPDGLYFVADDGVWMTTGNAPRKVSPALDPLYQGTVPVSFQGLAIDPKAFASLTWFQDRLYYAATTSAGDLILYVYDRDIGWTMWNVPAFYLTNWATGPSAAERLYFSYAPSSTNDIGVLDATVTTDDGAAIDSYYRTGFSDLGTPMSEKIVHGWQLDGNGSAGVKVAVNDGSLGSAATATLGGGSGTGNGFRPGRGWRGRNFSVQLEDVSGAAWTVNRVTAHVRGERPAATDSA